MLTENFSLHIAHRAEIDFIVDTLKHSHETGYCQGKEVRILYEQTETLTFQELGPFGEWANGLL